MKKALFVFAILFSATLISGCAPEVGSDAWCKDMKEKDKGDWSVNESKDYVNYCVLKNKKQD